MPLSVGIYVGLFLVSFAALMTEVALTRFFSFTIWYHFAYMTISVALLGYGAAGSAYYAFPNITRGGMERALGRTAVIGGIALVLCYVIICVVPFDPVALFPAGAFQWKTDVRQYVYLTIFYAAVVAPFFAAGLCVTIILSNAPARIAQLYFADLLGAAAGCAASVWLLTPLGAPGIIVLGAVLLTAAGVVFSWRQGALRWQAVGVLAVVGTVGLAAIGMLKPTVSASKFLPRITEGNAQTEVIFTRWNPVYRVDVVAGKSGTPIRFGKHAAWGVSDRFYSEPPENYVITHDGDASTMMYKFSGDFDAVRIIDRSLLILPYLLLEKPEVLVIGVGGGIDLLTAMKHGASHVTGIELNPVTVGLLKRDFVDYTGNVFNRPEVTINVDEGRNFVRRGDKKYDLIQITGIDTLAAIYSGAYVLSESYLYTTEAMREYLEHLTPNGMFAIVRGDAGWGNMPPRQVLRLLSIICTTLEDMGVAEPWRNIIVTKSMSKDATMPIFSILVRRAPFEYGQIARIQEHEAGEGFEPWHLPGQEIDSPAGELVRRTHTQRKEFIANYFLDLSPTTDDRPFFFNFLKWGRLLRAITEQSDYTFASGQLVLLLVLIQSVVFALLFIGAPLLRVGLRTPGRFAGRFLLYFACLGMGFIFIEISYIQRFALFLGSPVFSLSVTMFTLLLASGTGSFLSGTLSILADLRRALQVLIAALCVLNLFYIVALPQIFHMFLGNELAVRIAVAMVLLTPAGLVMGAFLPVGVRILGDASPQLIPWAWAANGMASVVGSILCIVLAMEIGFRAVNMVALAVYVLGVLLMLSTTRTHAAPATR